MSSPDKNTALYSASDIQKYLRGEMSAAEMYRLERAALEDPFLSDALEGMEIHQTHPSSPSLPKDLDELQQRLDKVANSRRSIPYPWRIAAAIILLLGLGLTAYFTFLNTTRQKNALAKADVSQNKPAARKEPAAAKKADRAPEPAAGKDKDAEAFAKVTPGVAINRERESLPATTSPSAAPPTALRQQEQQDKADVLKNSFMIRGQKDTTSYKNETMTNQGAIFIPDQPVYTGKVIDQNNNPLPGASLFLAGNYSVSSAVTDKNGLFSLRLPKKDSAIKLTVASVGYEQASLSLSTQNRTGNIIQLQPQNNALNEVVVSGYGVKRKEILKDNRQPRKPFDNKRAAPADGWPAYEIYLDANKKLLNPDSTIKGDEIISFLVDKEGGLSSFKVEQSLSTAHDSAAIHLVRQGPSWKLLKGKKGRAWVTISF